MSEVRMCDQPDCGRIFSLNEPGWQQFQSQTGASNYGTSGNSRILHICPDHGFDQADMPVIRPQIRPAKDDLDKKLEIEEKKRNGH